MTKSAKFSLERWRDIIFYGLLGGLILEYGQAVSGSFSKKISLFISNDFVLIPVLGIAAFIFIWNIHRLIGFRARHFQHTLRYPPLVSSIPIALLFASILPRNAAELTSPFSSASYLQLLTLYITAASLQLLFLWLYNRHRLPQRPSTIQKAQDAASFDDVPDTQLIQWILREKPISDSKEDFFRSRERSNRLIGPLQANTNQSVAIIGSYGCEKSSLVNLIAENGTRCEQPKIWFCRISCWGFDDSSTSQEIILSQAVARLAEEIDCFRIRGLPGRYLNAMSKTSGILEVTSEFVGDHEDPLSALQVFGPFLEAVNAKLIIAVEDTDRNGATFDVSHIQALLQRIRDVDRLSFIICAGPKAHLDFAKLCDRIEFIPDLEEECVLSIADRVLKICREKFPDDIDPLNKRKTILTQSEVSSLIRITSNVHTAWPTALTRLLATPRMLKATLRRFYFAWDQVHGEVDIEDLLIVCCLRTCAPEAFQFVSQNFKALKLSGEATRANDQISNDEITKSRKKLYETWSSIENRNEFEKRAAAMLIQKLLPATHFVFEERSFSEKTSLQLLCNDGPTNHWNRLVAEALLPSETREQDILRAISSANKEQCDISKLVETIIASEKCAKVFEHYADLLSTEKLPLVASKGLAEIRAMDSNKASRDSSGFIPIWRVARVKLRGTPEFLNIATDQITSCIPKSLRLATDIYYFWLSESDRQQQKHARKALMKVCRAEFTNKNVDQFIKGFDQDFPHTLFHLVFTSEYHENPPPPIIGARFWSWLGPLLLKSARLAPTVMLPQIAILLSRRDEQSERREHIDYQIDEQCLCQMFNELQTEILAELSKPFSLPEGVHQQTRIMLEMVPARAKELLHRRRD